MGSWRSSGMSRLQVSELDETLERLDIRCNRFIKGSKKYKEGINVLSQSQTSFADFLEEFCGGTDEESMMLGNDLCSSWFLPVLQLMVYKPQSSPHKEGTVLLLCANHTCQHMFWHILGLHRVIYACCCHDSF